MFLQQPPFNYICAVLFLIIFSFIVIKIQKWLWKSTYAYQNSIKNKGEIMIRKILSIIILIVLSISLFGCYEYTTPPVSTQVQEQQQVENNQQTLKTNQPIPPITKSLERENIINRLIVLNDESKVFYVYLISYGKVMAFYTAKGKVSSLNSYLNSQLRIVADPGCLNYRYEGSGTSCYQVIDTPDIDGSYGENADGVFFFTTEGAYVEWKGEYMASDFPLKLTTPPELVMNIPTK